MGKNAGGSSKGDVFVGDTSYPGRPKGLLDAISEIQQYFVVERSGSKIPSDFLTLKGKLGFFEVGFKGAFVSGLVSAALTPVAVGVFERFLPIFGSRTPSLYDRVFAVMLAVSFSIGYAVFISTVSRYYIGEISRSAIKNLMTGLITGAVFKLLLVFIFFHFVYYIVLDPDRLSKYLLMFGKYFKKPDTLNSIYVWLVNFREVFLISAYIVLLTTILFITIPIISIVVQSRKTKKIMEVEQMWK